MKKIGKASAMVRIKILGCTNSIVTHGIIYQTKNHMNFIKIHIYSSFSFCSDCSRCSDCSDCSDFSISFSVPK